MQRLTPQAAAALCLKTLCGDSSTGLEPPCQDSPQQAELLAQENAILARQLAQVQRRVTCQAVQQAMRIQALQYEVMQQRAALIVRDTALLLLRQDLAALRAVVNVNRQLD
jgi:hypothetical protein